MVHRNYIVLMPSNAGTNPNMDICLAGPVGTQSAPVAAAGGGTAPPSGWNGGDGAFYEWRGLPIRFETLFGATGFTPRARLGFQLSIVGIDDVDIPTGNFSRSVIGSYDGGSIISTTEVADPSYGPVLRLANTAATQGKVYQVSVTIFEPKDEDKSAFR